MDIKQLNYFITIVNQGLNLSKAAEELYLSQPSLSMMISKFEQTHDVKLFKRHGSRLTALTAEGDQLYRDAKKVVAQHNKLIKNVKNINIEHEGEITIGVPPFILTTLFSKILPQLMTEMPKIKFHIIEKGARELKADLLADKIDIAVLLAPHGIPEFIIESYEIKTSELVVLTSINNQEFNSEEKVTWEFISTKKLALFDSSFMTHHYVMDAFKRRQLYPNLIFTSKSWDFITYSTYEMNELYTILPYVITEKFSHHPFKLVSLHEPIHWRVKLCRLRKESHDSVEEVIYSKLLEAFK